MDDRPDCRCDTARMEEKRPKEETAGSMSDEEADLDRQLRIEMKRATLARIQSQNDSQPQLPGPQVQPIASKPLSKEAGNIAWRILKGGLSGIEKATRPGGPISKARQRAAEVKEDANS